MTNAFLISKSPKIVKQKPFSIKMYPFFNFRKLLSFSGLVPVRSEICYHVCQYCKVSPENYILRIHMCFIHGTPWTQNVNQIYIRCSEEFLDVFETSDVRSIYVLCPGSKQSRKMKGSVRLY